MLELINLSLFFVDVIGIDKSNGDPVAVKRLEKAKVFVVDDCDFEWKDLAVRMESCRISPAAVVERRASTTTAVERMLLFRN
ncbi:hypothetical protein A2U01_0018035 [Trifolium medium]|uniref:Uncharacterized protein n=1 Tax=Trifolium medium TaxID=97028 RepID=A0A392NBJ2_9FABA|nr:hypothetical protein [Trifolium medium]